MTRRALFKSLAGAFAGSLLARLPLAGKAVEVVDERLCWEMERVEQVVEKTDDGFDLVCKWTFQCRKPRTAFIAEF